MVSWGLVMREQRENLSLGVPCLVTVLCVLIWGPGCFDLILDLPNPEHPVPDGAAWLPAAVAQPEALLSSGDSTGADVAEETKFCLFGGGGPGGGGRKASLEKNN